MNTRDYKQIEARLDELEDEVERLKGMSVEPPLRMATASGVPCLSITPTMFVAEVMEYSECPVHSSDFSPGSDFSEQGGTKGDTICSDHSPCTLMYKIKEVIGTECGDVVGSETGREGKAFNFNQGSQDVVPVGSRVLVVAQAETCYWFLFQGVPLPASSEESCVTFQGSFCDTATGHIKTVITEICFPFAVTVTESSHTGGGS